MPDTKAFERAPRLVEGQKDPWYGTTVKKLILQMAPEVLAVPNGSTGATCKPPFAVWMVEDTECALLDVWWRVEREQPVDVSKILTREAELEALNLGRIRADECTRYRVLLGEGLARALDGDVEGASRVLDSAERLYFASLNSLSRSYYLTAALIGAAIATTGMCLQFYLNVDSDAANVAASRAIYCVGMGLLGSSSSIVFRASTFALDPATSRTLQALEALGRVASGMLSGFLLFLVTRSGQVFPQLMNASMPFAGHMLFAFAAGYLERFIPNLAESLQTFGKQRNETLGSMPQVGSSPTLTPSPVVEQVSGSNIAETQAATALGFQTNAHQPGTNSIAPNNNAAAVTAVSSKQPKSASRAVDAMLGQVPDKDAIVKHNTRACTCNENTEDTGPDESTVETIEATPQETANVLEASAIDENAEQLSTTTPHGNEPDLPATGASKIGERKT
jgi:hypothetical protein